LLLGAPGGSDKLEGKHATRIRLIFAKHETKIKMMMNKKITEATCPDASLLGENGYQGAALREGTHHRY